MDKFQTQQEVANRLAGMEELFAPEVKLTFIMRHPDNPKAYMFITRDDPDELIALLQRIKKDHPEPDVTGL